MKDFLPTGKLQIPGVSRELRDIIAGGLLLVFSLLVFILSFRIPTTAVSRLGSGFFPRLIGILLFVIGAMVFIGGLIRHLRCLKGLASPDMEGCEEVEFDRSVISTPLLIVLYFLLTVPLGFLIATSLYLFFQIQTLFPGKRMNRIFVAGLSVVFSLIVFYVFRTAFNLYLPEGILAGLF